VEAHGHSDILETHLLPNDFLLEHQAACVGVGEALLVHVLDPAEQRQDVLSDLLVLGDLATDQGAPLVLGHGKQLGILLLLLIEHEITPVGRVPMEASVGRALVVIVYHHLDVDLARTEVPRRGNGELMQDINRAVDLRCVRLFAVGNCHSLGNPVRLAELAALQCIIQNESLRTHGDTAGNEHFNSENEVRCVLTGIQSLDHIPSYYLLAWTHQIHFGRSWVLI